MQKLKQTQLGDHEIRGLLFLFVNNCVTVNKDKTIFIACIILTLSTHGLC